MTPNPIVQATYRALPGCGKTHPRDPHLDLSGFIAALAALKALAEILALYADNVPQWLKPD
jgi:hypothetical protein